MRGEVPYLSEFASTWSKTLPMKFLSCRGPDHIGPASYDDVETLHERRVYGTHMKDGVAFRTLVRYWWPRVNLVVVIRVARLRGHAGLDFTKRLFIEGLAATADVI